MWVVSYLYNGNRVSFNEDYDLGKPTYIPTGDTPQAAIQDVMDYIIELLNCNCLDTEITSGKVIVTEPSDGEVIGEYSDFQALENK